MKRRGQGEGSIFRRSDNGLWVGSLDLGWRGGRIRRSFYGKTRREVQDKVQTAQQSMRQGLEPASERLTVDAYLRDWIEATRETVRPSTWRRYEQITRQKLIPQLGHLPLHRLTPAHVEQMMRSLSGKGAGVRSVLHARAVLRSALSRAQRHGIIVRNAAALADPPKAPRREIQALGPDEVRTLLANIADDPHGPLYVVAMSTGMRQGELLGLKWSDVDLESGTASVRRALQRVNGSLQTVETKTERSRRDVPLTALAVDALCDLRRRPVQSAAGSVFTAATGLPLDGTNVTKRFQARLAAIGLPRVTFHALRHTTASLLLAGGTHPRVVMELLGHSQISLTMNTYTHVIPALERDAAEQMNALLTS